jgi:hypothetical protein
MLKVFRRSASRGNARPPAPAARAHGLGSGWLPVVLGMLLGQVLAGRAANPPAAPAPASTNGTPAGALAAPVPQSIFVIPASPKDGCNPFFPRSSLNAPAAKPKARVVDTSAMVLNGLTSPPRASAIINGRTFEPGESGEIRLPTGAKVQIQCLEIKADGVVVMVGSQRCELHLRRAL